ncbi:MAG: hypothetical protein H6974_12960 [Gammaproteobacteria bacterium]|nr:hypothetical protein [Gammaproteobacteria bacterium]MCP5197674.1 hypothetical protein [Gammaproteobacteria bacterium]
MNENVLRHRHQTVLVSHSVTEFECFSCGGTWQIADYAQRLQAMTLRPTYLHCPWCGISQRAPQIVTEDTDD